MFPVRPSTVVLSLLTACGPTSDDKSGETDETDTGAVQDTATDTGSPDDTDSPTDTGMDSDTDPDDPGPVVDEDVTGLGLIEGPTDLCSAGDDLTVSCGDGPEWVTRFTAPWDGEFLIKPLAVDYNLTLSVHDDDAAAAERACERSPADVFDTDEGFTVDDAIVQSLAEGDSVLVGLGQDDCAENALVIRGRPSCIPDAIDTQGLYIGFDEPLDDLGNGVVTPDGEPSVTISTFAGNSQVPGVYGQALGEGTCVTVDHGDTLWPGQLNSDVAFTWSVWIKTDTAPTSTGIIMELRDCVYDCPDGPNEDTALLRIFMANDGTVRAFSRQEDFSNQFTLSSTASLADGEWHHVVLTRGVQNLVGKDFFLYVDGVKVDELNRADGYTYRVSSGDEPLSIGCGLTQNTVSPTADLAFPGEIDSVVAYPARAFSNPIQTWYSCVTSAQLP